MPNETDIDFQPRIAGGCTDIGADELNILSPTLGITSLAPGSILLQLAGRTGTSIYLATIRHAHKLAAISDELFGQRRFYGGHQLDAGGNALFPGANGAIIPDWYDPAPSFLKYSLAAKAQRSFVHRLFRVSLALNCAFCSRHRYRRAAYFYPSGAGASYWTNMNKAAPRVPLIAI